MTCGLRSLRWAWAGVGLAALAIAGAARAASVPPIVDIQSVNVVETAGSAPFVILKSRASSYTKINVQTVDDTAKAGVDYAAVNKTLTLANNATSTAFPVPVIRRAGYQGPRRFLLKVAILRYGQVPASYTPISATITDDEPPPVQPPAPTGLPGEQAIADNFDGSTGLAGLGTPPPPAEPASAIRMFCGAGQLLYDDALVYPGQPGASPHLHQFFGNTAANGNSTYQSLRTTGGTTCGQSSTPFNRSAYWFPALLDGVGHVLKPYYVSLYYKRNPASDPWCRPLSADYHSLGQCVDLPNGIRFIWGYNMKTMTADRAGAIVFTCQPPDGMTGAPGRYDSLGALVAAGGCPVGGDIAVAASAPYCWDGQSLDSPDHRSHMAWSSGYYDISQLFRGCTADHPYVIPNTEITVHFNADENLSRWQFSCDAMMPAGSPAGLCFHVDYWEAWSPTIKDRWERGCIDAKLSCAGAAIDATTMIKGGDWPWPEGFPKHVLVPVP